MARGGLPSAEEALLGPCSELGGRLPDALRRLREDARGGGRSALRVTLPEERRRASGEGRCAPWERTLLDGGETRGGPFALPDDRGPREGCWRMGPGPLGTYCCRVWWGMLPEDRGPAEGCWERLERPEEVRGVWEVWT